MWVVEMLLSGIVYWIVYAWHPSFPFRNRDRYTSIFYRLMMIAVVAVSFLRFRYNRNFTKGLNYVASSYRLHGQT